MPNCADILTTAQEIARTTDRWADLSNALFDPLDGLIAKAYASKNERDTFRNTATYSKLRDLVTKAMQGQDILAGATPTKSGRFVVRLPKSLHGALDGEAQKEGVSLNQLVVAKLACQLDALAGSRDSLIVRAYGEVREGHSTDRVVADPELDRRFLKRCRELGARGTDFDLNWALFNARKNGLLTHLPKTERFTVGESDEFEYASEIALTEIQRQQHAVQQQWLSLDHILCDPDLALEFDRIAEKLAPGYTPLQYRWVALGLRKAARLKSKIQDVSVPEFQDLGPTSRIRARSIPGDGGIYLFGSKDESFYVGETGNLRDRITRHLEYSGSRGLPEWLFDKRPTIRLGISPLPGVKEQIRRTMELRAVAKFRPRLNYRVKVA